MKQIENIRLDRTWLFLMGASKDVILYDGRGGKWWVFAVLRPVMEIVITGFLLLFLRYLKY